MKKISAAFLALIVMAGSVGDTCFAFPGSNLFSSAKNTFAKKLTDATGYVTDKASGLKDAIADKASGIKTAVTAKASDLKTAVAEKASGIKTAVTDKVNQALGRNQKKDTFVASGPADGSHVIVTGSGKTAASNGNVNIKNNERSGAPLRIGTSKEAPEFHSKHFEGELDGLGRYASDNLFRSDKSKAMPGKLKGASETLSGTHLDQSTPSGQPITTNDHHNYPSPQPAIPVNQPQGSEKPLDAVASSAPQLNEKKKGFFGKTFGALKGGVKGAVKKVTNFLKNNNSQQISEKVNDSLNKSVEKIGDKIDEIGEKATSTLGKIKAMGTSAIGIVKNQLSSKDANSLLSKVKTGVKGITNLLKTAK